MPEAAINEHRDSSSPEDYVGSRRSGPHPCSCVNTEPQAHGVQCRPHRSFRPRVTSCTAAHLSRPRRVVEHDISSVHVRDTGLPRGLSQLGASHGRSSTREPWPPPAWGLTRRRRTSSPFGRACNASRPTLACPRGSASGRSRPGHVSIRQHARTAAHARRPLCPAPHSAPVGMAANEK
jgi:hypothetical protein